MSRHTSLQKASGFLVTTVLLSVFAMTTLSSCGDDDDSSANNQAIIPFHKDNLWIYQDTAIIESYVYVSTDTVTITDSRISHDTTWWEFSSPFNPIIDALEFQASGDTIFSLQHTESPNGMRGILSKEYVRAPANGSYTFTPLYAGDAFYEKTVKKLNTPVITPAGTFNGCYEYTYTIAPNNITEIVCPGVGVVKLTSTGTGITATSYSRVLKKYTIQ